MAFYPSLLLEFTRYIIKLKVYEPINSLGPVGFEPLYKVGPAIV